ncbi:MAG: enolase C-terminal domain-like protein [bacterium]
MIETEVFGVAVPLKKKFVVSKGGAAIKRNLITVLNNRYFGEAATSVHYGPQLPQLKVDLTEGLKKLRELETIDTDTLSEIESWDIHPIARAAIVGMVLNYISGETRRYPWEILDLGSPLGIRSSWTVAIDDPNDMIAAIKSSPYPIIKIKMGNEQDLLLLDQIGDLSDKEIRVDANGGWSCAKAEEMIFHLSRLGVKVIEQPTDIEFVSEWRHLKGKIEDVELFVDEGLNNLEDYRKYAEHIDGVNIKPEKSGGIVQASKLAKQAATDGKKIMLGCMVQSSLGIAQAVYMSSQADYFDLDGPLLLESDIGRGIRYNRESIEVDREIIGGPKIRRDIVQKYLDD